MGRPVSRLAVIVGVSDSTLLLLLLLLLLLISVEVKLEVPSRWLEQPTSFLVVAFGRNNKQHTQRFWQPRESFGTAWFE